MKTLPNFLSKLEPLVDNDMPGEDNQFSLPLITSESKYINLKGLDKWDEQHLRIRPKERNQLIKRKATHLLKKSSLMCLNYKSNASTNFSRMKLSPFVNDHLNDFYQNMQQETSSLLAQNINMVKKRFDFDIFRKTANFSQAKADQTRNKPQEELYQIGNELAVRKKIASTQGNEVKYNVNIDKDELIDIQNRTLKHNNLKLEGKYDKVTSSEYYKEIVKSKNVLEKAYRREIKEVSVDIELAVKDVKMLNDELSNLYQQIEEKKRKYYDNKELYKIIENEKNQNGLSRKEFVQQTRDMDSIKHLRAQIEKLKKEYDQQRSINEVTVDYIRAEINSLKIGIETLQVYKKSIIQQLKNYYYQILKEGVDVRSIGLCWVLIRIYELGAQVTNNDFPQFLEYMSINYLMEYSKKAIVKKKLNVVLNLLVGKYLISPKTDEAKISEEITQINKEFSVFQNYSDFFQQLNQKKKNHFVNQNEVINRKDKEIFQKSMNQWRDLATSQNLLCEDNLQHEEGNHRRMRECDSFEETKEDLSLSNFNSTKGKNMPIVFSQREIVEACSQIRVEIKKIDNEMKTLKQEHMKYFKKKHEHCKAKGISECVKYDLMFCSLFGNYAIV